MNVLELLGDSHCHLDVTCTKQDIVEVAQILNSPGFEKCHDFFHIMTTNHLDLELMDVLLKNTEGDSVVPYWGVHPWYSHLFYDKEKLEEGQGKGLKEAHYNSVLSPAPTEQLLSVLPEPIDIYEHLHRIRGLIKKHPLKYGIGEIGLDRTFRVPLNGFFGNQVEPLENQRLSYSRVTIDHQQHIFKLHLGLANELQRPVSLHCVKAHGMLYNIVTGYTKIPSIILHSYSGSLEQAKMWMGHYRKAEQKLYFSLSNFINGGDNKETLLLDIVAGLDEDQILIETDVSVDKYICGKKLRDVTSGRVLKEQNPEKEVDSEPYYSPPYTNLDYFHNLYEIYRKVCAIRGWDTQTDHWKVRANLRESIKNEQ